VFFPQLFDTELTTFTLLAIYFRFVAPENYPTSTSSALYNPLPHPREAGSPSR
jgi:hypothetical protein